MTEPFGRPPLWIYGALLLLGTMWGGSFSLAKIAVSTGGHPFGVAMWQGFGGGAVLLVVGLLRGRPPPLSARYVLFYIVTGAAGIALPSAAFYAAATHLPAGILSMLVTTVPMMTYALALSLSMEQMTARRLVGLTLGLAGVWLILGPEANLPGEDGLFWALVALIAPICYAVNNIIGARFRPIDADSLALAAGMLLSSGLLLGGAALATGNTYSVLPPWDVTHLAIALLILIATFAHFLFFVILNRAGPVFFSQVAYVVTIAGVLWGMLLFGETHGAWIWLSLVLLLAGVALVNPRKA